MPNNVLTFRVNPDSEFYKQYFEAQEERKHFRELAKIFFDKHDIDGSYYHCQNLEVKFQDDNVRKKFADQLCIKPDNRGFYRFKKNSAMNKEWVATVTSQVNFKRLEQCELWFLDVMMSGTYSMWHMDGEIYGKVEENGLVPLQPASYMIPIKISEYYVVVEKAEEINKILRGEPSE
ncbi:MAG: hypothetical protein IJZ68_08530 [Bacteroidaceae bacterium]|nr:hypothetical protein [Bacteroidaceae bacterium]